MVDVDRPVVLSDGTRVPRAERYKHLGTIVGNTALHEQTREKVKRRCRGCLMRLGRIEAGAETHGAISPF